MKQIGDRMKIGQIWIHKLNGTFVFNDKILTDIKPKYEDIESNFKDLIYV